MEKKVKLEERFCTICYGDVSGEVVVCPRADHWMCAVHMQDPDFNKKCPVCKTPMDLLKPQEHDLLDDKPQLNEDRSIMLQLMRMPDILLEQMKTWFTRSIWADQFYYTQDCEQVQEAALSSDRNWAFFTHHLELAYRKERRITLSRMCEVRYEWTVFAASTRFWRWILPLMGKEMLMMLNRTYEVMLMEPFKRMEIACCEIIAQYMQEQGYRLPEEGPSMVDLRRKWLAFSLPVALQLCDMLHLELDYFDFLYCSRDLHETAAIQYYQEKFPEKAGFLWDAFMPGANVVPFWKDHTASFMEEVLKLKPPGWTFQGTIDIPWFRALSSFFVIQDNEIKEYCFKEWQAQGAAAASNFVTAYQSYIDGQLMFSGNLIRDEKRTCLHIVRFEKRELRVYELDREIGWDEDYEVAKKALRRGRIKPEAGLRISFASAVYMFFDNKPF